MARHFMAAVAAALLALTGCSAAAEAPTTTSPSTVTTTTTTGTPSRPVGLHAEWSAKFAAVTKAADGSPKCTEARPKSEACVQHLTEIVTLALNLRDAIEARPDVASYSGTLAQIDQVTGASAEYAKCTAECYGYALTIGLSSVTLMLRLQVDDPAA